MSIRTILFLAAMLAGTAVALGAYAAHGLEDRLISLDYQKDLEQRMEWFQTGVRYQMYHALGLFLVASLSLQLPTAKLSKIAPWAFLIGCLLFSGSLYTMTLASPAWKKLGAVVPLGGLSFLIGWAAIAHSALRFKDDAK